MKDIPASEVAATPWKFGVHPEVHLSSNKFPIYSFNEFDTSTARLCLNAIVHVMLSQKNESPNNLYLLPVHTFYLNNEIFGILFSGASSMCSATFGQATHILAFRGTATDDEFGMYDVRTKLNDKNIVTGFYDAFKNIMNEEGESLMDVCQRMNGITILTGHSIGAAVATILAYEMHNVKQSFACVYTFGSPRVLGTEVDTSFISKRMFRCFNENDPIPGVPDAASLTPLLTHVGKPVVYHFSGENGAMNHFFYMTTLLHVKHDPIALPPGEKKLLKNILFSIICILIALAVCQIMTKFIN